MHMISAIITKLPVDLALAKKLSLPVLIENDITIIPLDAHHVHQWALKLGLSAASTSEMALDCPVTHQFAKQLKITEYALVETEYFGGVGTQFGGVFYNSDVVIPITEDGINQALRAIGVCKSPGKFDEFDTINLGKYRTFSEFFEEPRQL